MLCASIIQSYACLLEVCTLLMSDVSSWHAVKKEVTKEGLIFTLGTMRLVCANMPTHLVGITTTTQSYSLVIA